ncbi:MAG TPA: hypothetical protein VFE78_38285 [Gemmataceae bacterium]|jgi:hypothetical protein|nr:hypothetical protein [Gemmataceae bacterium]
MPWQQRGTKRYFYCSERAGGRPVRRYVGAAGSPAVELAATADDLRRLGREIAARERHAERERQQEAERSLLELCALTDVLARAALVLAGYHRHDRGEWRHRREPEPTG